jgi:molybdopterin-binding protein
LLGISTLGPIFGLPFSLEGRAMKLSARNQIKGTVTAIKQGAVEAQVTMDIGGQMLTAVVTMDAIEDLGLTVGSPAVAIIKSDHVIVGVE